MVGATPHYATETQFLRRVANDPDCSWRWTVHVLERMTQRGFTADDVKHAVMNGGVVLEEQAKRDRLWRVEGKDVDGKRMQVVVAVDGVSIRVKVVTAF
jgi:Domain of unknown function (DUF4258)